jgi:hypothetical protein
VLLAALALTSPATAQFVFPSDLTWAVSAGRHLVNKVELNIGWTQQRPLWQGEDWHLRLRHEFVLGRWHVPAAQDITEVGYSPVFRLENVSAEDTSVPHAFFFIEGSVGARLLSHTRLTPNLTLSTAFQFADMAGAGVQWEDPDSGAVQTLGLRLQHQSNADIKKPNPGINFVTVYYRFAF